MVNVRGELIGLSATVVASRNSCHVGLSGVICDETFHTLTLGSACLAKADITLSIDRSAVAGATLVGRPWQRLVSVRRVPCRV